MLFPRANGFQGGFLRFFTSLRDLNVHYTVHDKFYFTNSSIGVSPPLQPNVSRVVFQNMFKRQIQKSPLLKKDRPVSFIALNRSFLSVTSDVMKESKSTK